MDRYKLIFKIQQLIQEGIKLRLQQSQDSTKSQKIEKLITQLKKKIVQLRDQYTKQQNKKEEREIKTAFITFRSMEG